MEGDAGTGPLNADDAGDAASSPADIDQAAPEATVGDSAESLTGAEQTSTEATVGDSAESLTGAEQTSTEAMVGDSAESLIGAEQTSTEAMVGDSAESLTGAEQPVGALDTTRLSRRWVVGICAVLILVTAGLTAGGFAAVRYHRDSETIARDNAEAVATAKDCVLATQAPAVKDLIGAEQKIIDCATGEFRTQATLYSGAFVQAYRAANVQVEVAEMRAAVERNNPDGSVDVLVAFRVKVDNVEAKGREFGYRLRAQMAREDGQYRIAKLDQVAR